MLKTWSMPSGVDYNTSFKSRRQNNVGQSVLGFSGRFMQYLATLGVYWTASRRQLTTRVSSASLSAWRGVRWMGPGVEGVAGGKVGRVTKPPRVRSMQTPGAHRIVVTHDPGHHPPPPPSTLVTAQKHCPI